MNSWTEWHEQVFQMIGRAKRAGSRAASSKDDVIITEMDSNGVLISRPVKRVQSISAQPEQEQEKEPIVIDLQSKSKAGSTVVTRTDVNKARAIAEFIASNGKW